MAEEFQAGICGGNWWIHPPKSVFVGGGSSPCSMGNIITSEMGTTYGSWMTDMVDMKQARSSCKEFVNVPAETTADTSMVLFQNSQKPLQADSDSGGSSILIDSTLPMMGFGLSSPSSSSDWNQALLRGSGRVESYNSMMQEDMNNSGLNSSQVQKDWSPKSFTSTGEDSSITSFKPMSQDFSLDQQQRLNPVNSSVGNSTATCQGLSTGLISSMGSSSSSSSSSYGYPSSLIQSLFEDDPQPPQQQSLFNSRSINYSSMPSYGTNLSDLSPSWPNKLSSFLKSSMPKQQQQPSNGLQFSNNAPFWNATATALSTGFLPSSPSQFILPSFEEKPNAPNLITKPNNEEVRESGSAVKGSEPATKRPRIETPSPLPTFKVRKEKLGDRITALQQLVSPFGKTDTASVLHEAIEYIKFLHDQVSVLSTPYMKNGNPTQQHHQQVQAVDKMKELEVPKQDLRSRGLCLVPIASTFPVTNETTADFWTPTFGATFR